MTRPAGTRTRLRVDDRLLGLITVTVIAGLLAGDFTGAFRDAFSGGGRTVKAVFADAQQLQAGDFVRIDGVDAGSVTGITLNPGARSATVTMQVDPSAGPLYANASAQLRWRTVLGASYAVALDRGNPGTGPLGSGTIAESHTSNQVELEDVLAFDSGGARAGLQAMPGALAAALRDPQPPAQSLGTLAAISPSLATALNATRGQRPDTDLQQLIRATASTVSALDTPTGEARTLISAAAATLEQTAASQADIRATIAAAPAALASTRQTVTRLNVTLGLADPLLATLKPGVPEVAPTAAQLHPTVVRLDAVLRRAVPLLHALRPAVSSLAGAARAGLPLLTALTPSLDRVNNSILPYLGAKDPETQHTTAEMIGGTFTGLGSGAPAQMDAAGHFIRFPATSGSSPVYLPCQIYYGNPDAKKLVECQTLQQALQTFLSYSPLGPPPQPLAHKGATR
jgi:phospholipid/cholesterol/gamma-HCH transport system substrate-binding protein